MPPFDEGVAQLNVALAAGHVAAAVEGGRRDGRAAAAEDRGRRRSSSARTGRAELDEHIIGVNMTEFIISFDPHSGRSREEVLDDIREAMADIPGIVTSVEQPMAHLISAMLSGVQSQVAVKLYGDDLDVLRGQGPGDEGRPSSGVPGVKDLMVEPQIIIPQLRIELDRPQLARYGLTPDDVNRFVETAMHGRVVSEVLVGQRTFDLFVRLDEPYRENLEALRRMSLQIARGRDHVARLGGQDLPRRRPQHDQPRAGPAADRLAVQHGGPRPGRRRPRHPSGGSSRSKSRCPPATSSNTADSSRASSRPRG